MLGQEEAGAAVAARLRIGSRGRFGPHGKARGRWWLSHFVWRHMCDGCGDEEVDMVSLVGELEQLAAERGEHPGGSVFHARQDRCGERFPAVLHAEHEVNVQQVDAVRAGAGTGRIPRSWRADGTGCTLRPRRKSRPRGSRDAAEPCTTPRSSSASWPGGCERKAYGAFSRWPSCRS